MQNYEKEHMSRAAGRGLNVSTKASIELCNAIRGKTVGRAKAILQGVIDIKTPIRFTRFTNGVGHRRGMASGRYPAKAATEILSLLESAESNAQFKGLNTSDLLIRHISAQKGANIWRYGRIRRRKTKNTHVEIVLVEGKKKEERKQAKKAESHKEAKQ